jgi:hypothetical protein
VARRGRADRRLRGGAQVVRPGDGSPLARPEKSAIKRPLPAPAGG